VFNFVNFHLHFRVFSITLFVILFDVVSVANFVGPVRLDAIRTNIAGKQWLQIIQSASFNLRWIFQIVFFRKFRQVTLVFFLSLARYQNALALKWNVL
jgi:hypothetical protein